MSLNCRWPTTLDDETIKKEGFGMAALLMIIGVPEITVGNISEITYRLKVVDALYNEQPTETNLRQWVGLRTNVYAESRSKWLARMRKNYLLRKSDKEKEAVAAAKASFSELLKKI